MKLFIWSGFPGKETIKGFAIANTVNEARIQILDSIRSYPELHDYILVDDPEVYDSPAGWMQEVGAQLA